MKGKTQKSDTSTSLTLNVGADKLSKVARHFAKTHGVDVKFVEGGQPQTIGKTIYLPESFKKWARNPKMMDVLRGYLDREVWAIREAEAAKDRRKKGVNVSPSAHILNNLFTKEEIRRGYIETPGGKVPLFSKKTLSSSTERILGYMTAGKGQSAYPDVMNFLSGAWEELRIQRSASRSYFGMKANIGKMHKYLHEKAQEFRENNDGDDISNFFLDIRNAPLLIENNFIEEEIKYMSEEAQQWVEAYMPELMAASEKMLTPEDMWNISVAMLQRIVDQIPPQPPNPPQQGDGDGDPDEDGEEGDESDSKSKKSKKNDKNESDKKDSKSSKKNKKDQSEGEDEESDTSDGDGDDEGEDGEDQDGEGQDDGGGEDSDESEGDGDEGDESDGDDGEGDDGDDADGDSDGEDGEEGDGDSDGDSDEGDEGDGADGNSDSDSGESDGDSDSDPNDESEGGESDGDSSDQPNAPKAENGGWAQLNEKMKDLRDQIRDTSKMQGKNSATGNLLEEGKIPDFGSRAEMFKGAYDPIPEIDRRGIIKGAPQSILDGDFIEEKTTPRQHVLDKINRTVNYTARTLGRKLKNVIRVLAQNETEYDKRDGDLDDDCLADIVSGKKNVFMETTPGRNHNNIAWLFLVDMSGSMGGDKEILAIEACMTVAQAISDAGNDNFCIAAFDNLGRYYRRNGKSITPEPNFSRFVRQESMRIQLVKKFSDPYRKVKDNVSALQAGGSNADGDAVRWATARLLEVDDVARRELVVFSDGHPSAASASYDALNRDLIDAIEEAREAGVGVTSVGIMHDTSVFYGKEDSLVVYELDELVTNFVKLIRKKMLGGKGLVKRRRRNKDKHLKV